MVAPRFVDQVVEIPIVAEPMVVVRFVELVERGRDKVLGMGMGKDMARVAELQDSCWCLYRYYCQLNCRFHCRLNCRLNFRLHFRLLHYLRYACVVHMGMCQYLQECRRIRQSGVAMDTEGCRKAISKLRSRSLDLFRDSKAVADMEGGQLVALDLDEE